MVDRHIISESLLELSDAIEQLAMTIAKQDAEEDINLITEKIKKITEQFSKTSLNKKKRNNA